MALSLTSSGLKRDATRAAGEVGVSAASAVLGTSLGRVLTNQASGAGRLALSAGLVGGGAAAMVWGRGKIVPFAGVGLALGSILSMLER